ncbi:hypothetical protein M3Y99_00738300 [Aphelenchoides fujianensis]|nr:hypothetical protein M3Y99_00738300 [Aphelenchoides fujianensis]
MKAVRKRSMTDDGGEASQVPDTSDVVSNGNYVVSTRGRRNRCKGTYKEKGRQGKTVRTAPKRYSRVSSSSEEEDDDEQSAFHFYDVAANVQRASRTTRGPIKPPTFTTTERPPSGCVNNAEPVVLAVIGAAVLGYGIAVIGEKLFTRIQHWRLMRAME